jgi:mannose-1-phosphate guanylyltransferase
MFCWRSSTVLDGLARHAPELLETVRGIAEAGAPGTPDFARALEERFAAAPSISIDYALMEKAENVLVVDATFEWNDVGHWLAMRDLWPDAGDGNVARGRILALDASNNIVYGPDRLTALIGVEDHIVVSTGDVTLVCPADRAQDVKLALERLGDSGADNQA